MKYIPSFDEFINESVAIKSIKPTKELMAPIKKRIKKASPWTSPTDEDIKTSIECFNKLITKTGSFDKAAKAIKAYDDRDTPLNNYLNDLAEEKDFYDMIDYLTAIVDVYNSELS